MRTVSTLGLACVLACAFIACGGSGGDGGAGMGAAGGAATPVTGGTGGMDDSAGTGGTGGVPPMMMVPDMMLPMMMMPMNPAGVGEENAPCMPGAMAMCNEGLQCATLPDPFNGVCGRKCAMDSDCTMPDEVCSAYSMMDTQGICINLVPAWELFLFSETSACEDRATPVGITGQDQLPGGICLELCMLAGADPMNLPSDLPKEQIVTCAMGQECLPVLSDPMGMAMDDALGACGVGVERGAVCDSTKGEVCTDVKDICAPSDPSKLDGEQKCFQNCEDMSVTCDMGTTCTPLMVMGMQVAAYCL